MNLVIKPALKLSHDIMKDVTQYYIGITKKFLISHYEFAQILHYYSEIVCYSYKITNNGVGK